MRDDHAGSYLLRTSLSDWDDERIVRLYWTLSEVEATFRSLKSELGMRPIYHHKKSRVAAHLFISVVAYQAVHLFTTDAARQWCALKLEYGSQQAVDPASADDGDG